MFLSHLGFCRKNQHTTKCYKALDGLFRTQLGLHKTQGNSCLTELLMEESGPFFAGSDTFLWQRPYGLCSTEPLCHVWFLRSQYLVIRRQIVAFMNEWWIWKYEYLEGNNPGLITSLFRQFFEWRRKAMKHLSQDNRCMDLHSNWPHPPPPPAPNTSPWRCRYTNPLNVYDVSRNI
jgi:hypothetical protein